jgi:hypothetical protein
VASVPKKIVALAAAAVGFAVAARRIQAERAEADLWREATDDPAAPTTPSGTTV